MIIIIWLLALKDIVCFYLLVVLFIMSPGAVCWAW